MPDTNETHYQKAYARVDLDPQVVFNEAQIFEELRQICEELGFVPDFWTMPLTPNAIEFNIKNQRSADVTERGRELDKRLREYQQSILPAEQAKSD